MRQLPSIPYPDLPVSARREDILQALHQEQVVIIVGDTGSGKTTQLPKISYERARSLKLKTAIACTQPRRVAASSVSKRIADEMGSTLGDLVGYQVRFIQKSHKHTAIKLMTDGVLLAHTQRDPLLKSYHTILIDEAHERSLNIDFLLGYLKRILPQRPDLRVIVSSATLDSGSFSEYFHGAPVIEVAGRTYPVSDAYLPAVDYQEPLSSHVKRAIIEVNKHYPHGDILIFLPGEREITICADALKGEKYSHTDILPLFGRLDLKDQEAVFTVGKRRRIVLATNVAETSLTIPAITSVIDTGLVRISRWSPARQIQSLQLESISQASARQRRGRCGRIAKGFCLRLYEEETLLNAAPFTDPEIRRSSLAGVILKMALLKLGKINDFPFLTPPAPKAIAEGKKTLLEIGALDKKENITPQGKLLARLPLDPRLGKMLLEAHRHKVLDSTIVIVAGMTLQDIRLVPKESEGEAKRIHSRWVVPDSDFLTLLALWCSFSHLRSKKGFKRNALRRFCKENFMSYRRILEWDEVVYQLSSLLEKHLTIPRPIPPTSLEQGDDMELIALSILSGIPLQFGQYDPQNRHYKSTGGRHFSIFPSSCLFGAKRPEWVMAFELVETSKLWARKLWALDVAWIEKTIPHLCKNRYHSAYWDPSQRAVYGLKTVLCKGLTLRTNIPIFYGKVAPKEAHEVFIREALLNGKLMANHPLLDAITTCREDAQILEAKQRRTGGLWNEEALFDFLFSAIDEQICTTKGFLQWNKKNTVKLPPFSEFLWENPTDLSLYADTLSWEGKHYDLTYIHDVESPEDGLCIDLNLEEVMSFPSHLAEWLVEGYLEEKVYLLLRSLPKQQRQVCAPARGIAQNFAESWKGWLSNEPLCEELAAFCSEKTGHTILSSMFDPSRLPAYLHPTFRVWGKNDDLIDSSKNLNALQVSLSSQLQRQKEKKARQQYTQKGQTQWLFKPLLTRTPEGAYLALYDEGKSVGVAPFFSISEAQKNHALGIVRLFKIQERELIAYVEKHLGFSVFTKMLIPFFEKQKGDFSQQLVSLACQGVLCFPLPTDKDAYQHAIQNARQNLYETAHQLVNTIEKTLPLHQSLIAYLEENANTTPYQELCEDIQDELFWLFDGAWMQRAGYKNLLLYPQILEGIKERLERVKSLPLLREEEKRLRITPLFSPWFTLWTQSPHLAELIDLGWLIEGWRINLFAPKVASQLGNFTRVSEKKIKQALQKAKG